MKSYLISVTFAVILSAIIDILLPNSMQKYVSLITGTLILLCVIAPIADLSGSTLNLKIADDIKYNSYDVNDIIIKEFKSNTEKDIESRLNQEFNVKCNVNVIIDMFENNIRGIKKITLNTLYNEKIKERISYIYGCNDIEFIRRIQ